jgi:AmmeMemoRadiSam system protein B
MAVIKELKSKGDFTTMSISQDEDEHSLEMHLPYIYAILSKYTLEFPVFDIRNFSSIPPLVPIMVGSTNVAKEKEYGRLLAPYLANRENLFIVSSDFCHWYRILLAGLTQGLSISVHILQQRTSQVEYLDTTSNLRISAYLQSNRSS